MFDALDWADGIDLADRLEDMASEEVTQSLKTIWEMIKIHAQATSGAKFRESGRDAETGRG